MKLYCKDCWHFGRCSACGRTVDFAVSDGVCRDFDECKPITNADRIRAMSDEELAKLLTHISEVGCPSAARRCKERCIDCFFDWLKEPAEEVDDG